MQGPKAQTDVTPTRTTTGYTETSPFGQNQPFATGQIMKAAGFNPTAGPGTDYLKRTAGSLPGVDPNFASSALQPTRDYMNQVYLPQEQAKLASQYAMTGGLYGSPYAQASANLSRDTGLGLAQGEQQFRTSQYDQSQQRISDAQRQLIQLGLMEPSMALAPLQYLQQQFLPTSGTAEAVSTSQYGPSPFEEVTSAAAALLPLFLG